MALLDVYSDDLKRSAVNEPVRIPKPTAKASVWNFGFSGPSDTVRAMSGVDRGIAAGAAESFGMMGDVLGAFGQAYATTAPGAPMFGEDPYALQTAEARQKMTTGEGIDYSSDAGDLFRNVARGYKPDPKAAGLAENIVFDLSRVLTKAVGYSIAGGGPVAGGVATAVDEGMTIADNLKQEGVDLSTRTQVGAIQGVATGLGVVLPVHGKTIAQTAALVAAGGPGAFIASTAASRAILEKADYSIASQYDPFDPVGLALSTVIPTIFGGASLRGVRIKAKAEADMIASDTPPGALNPIAAAVAEYKPTTDEVAAARVAMQMEHRRTSNPGDPADLKAMDQHEAALSKAEEQMARGEPVQVSDVAPMPRVIAAAEREANFKAWFQDSKVVDGDGKPLVVYHGTTADVPGFSLDFVGADGVKYDKPAIFATTDVKLANDYAVNKFDRVIADAMRSVEAHKNKNPGDYGDGYEVARKAVSDGFKQVRDEGRPETGGGANVVPLHMALQNPLVVDGKGGRFMQVMPDAIARAVADGNDGMIVSNVIDHASPATDYPSQVVVAFRPEQVKSAIGNSGKFDPNSPSLTDPLTEFAANIERGLNDMRRAVEADPANAPRPVDVVPDHVAESQLSAKIANDFDAAVTEYSARPDAKGGKVLNTDTARELSPIYLADRTRSAAVHEPASQFVKDLYAKKLKEAPGPGEAPLVVFSAGGTGAGKTTALDGLPAIKAVVDRAQMVYDTNMNGFESSRTKIDQALAAGKLVRIFMVARDPVDALVNGALPRAESQTKKFGSGRTVPLGEHAKTHIGAMETVPKLAEHYADDPRVQVQVIDNSLGKGNAQERDLPWLKNLKYNDVEQRLGAALEKAYEAKTISEATYRGFKGPEAGQAVRGLESGTRGTDAQVRPGSRDGAGQEPQPRGEGQVSGLTSAVTERGLSVPLRYKLVESDALVTSHDNDLKTNPAFPAELQPRDRSRSASAEQIARIENNINPELLGESPKASDGAPITGPDGVVESGNARTIALRRAYDSGKADAYKVWLEANAARFGLKPEDVAGMKRPVLVRERTGEIDRAEFARQANESTVAAMSPTEQAKSDAGRVTDLTGLEANDDGTINIAKSSAFIRQFMQQVVSPTERGGMMQANGNLSQAGMQRMRNAIFAKAYGDADLVAMLTESTDANVRNILAGMLRAAPKVARYADLAASGAREQANIAGPLSEAVQLFSQLRSEGRTVGDLVAQGSMFDDGPKPAVVSMLKALQADSRAPKRVAAMIEGMVDSVDSLGDPRQAGMFGGPKGEEAVTQAAQQSAISSRLAQAQEQFPDLQVQMDGMDAPMRLADFIEQVKRDADAERADAPDLLAAAECALLQGGI